VQDEVWNKKVKAHLKKAEIAIREEDAVDLIYRAVMIGENSTNLLRLTEEGKSERNLYMLKTCLLKYHAAGILSKDYRDDIARAYELYRENAYVDDCDVDDDDDDDDDIDFDEVNDLFKEISKMVFEIHDYLLAKGRLTK